MVNEEIGKRLTEMREERGQTKRTVAKRIGIPYRTYCSYEYGERNPSDSAKVRIAEYFGVTVETLFYANAYHETR